MLDEAPSLRAVEFSAEVQEFRNHEYSRPVSYMREYLARMSEAPVFAQGPPGTARAGAGRARPQDARAGSGGRRGAHPYFVPPEHTATARQTMGSDSASCPEQMVILDTDPAAARAVARGYMSLYLQLPNYTNNLLRLGFAQSDIDGGPGNGPSNRLADEIVAWGTPEQIAPRVQQHFEASADHVAVQVLANSPDATADGWRTNGVHPPGLR